MFFVCLPGRRVPRKFNSPNPERKTSPAHHQPRPFPEHVEGPGHGHPGRGVPSDAVLPAVFITYRLQVVGIPQDIPFKKKDILIHPKKWIDFNQQMRVL